MKPKTKATSITEKDGWIVLDALNGMADVLADCNYTWSKKVKNLYQRACRLVRNAMTEDAK